MTIWQRIVQANRPGAPEHSVPFRAASTATVVIAIGACWSQGELGAAFSVFAIAATVIGNVLSYRQRAKPWGIVKPILAVCAVGGFVWFIARVSHTATPGDISTVEAPLAVLFAWVLCTHAFDVPARRDVAYSLAGSAALMAVAAAQSVDLSLGVYVLAWVVAGVWGLVTMWQSMSATRGVPWLTLGIAGLAVLVVAVLLVAVLPAPTVSASLIFPSSAANSGPVNSPSNLTDGSASLPAHAASPSGRIAVGGYLGFAKSLDTGVRASLGNETVLRVRAARPSFWVGQTYDTWNGESWTTSASTSGKGVTKVESGSPFQIPLSNDQQAPYADGTTDIQTFYLAQSGPNLVFHADNAERVYLQSRALYLTGGGTIVSAASMGAGTVYTVVSDDITATDHQLSRATVPPSTGFPIAMARLPLAQETRYLQLPHPYPRVQALAKRITAGIGSPGDADPMTYAKVAAIEYDPNRTCRIALLHYADGEKRYILAPAGLKVGDVVESGPKADIRTGNSLPMRFIPTGSTVHNVELRPGGGAKLARSAGKVVAVVGASFIGLEAAAALRKLGLEVHVVAPEPVPFGKVLGEDVGLWVKALHEKKGVIFHLGRSVQSYAEGALHLDAGVSIKADLVVVGVGVKPRVRLAEAAGLKVDNGVLVDDRLRAAEGIYAVGDIARYPDPMSGELIRVEHWVHAERQGQHVARLIMGEDAPFSDVPFFWSAHYESALHYDGHAVDFDPPKVEGSIEDYDALVRYEKSGALVAVVTLNRDLASLEAEAAFERRSALRF